MPSSRWLALLLASASLAPGLSAQDVEMLGRHYGTRPPDGYYREIASNPDAFRFRRGRAARLREAIAPESAQALRGPGPALALGPRAGPVVGDVHIPAVLGMFSESVTPAYGPSTIEAAYFGTQPGVASVSTYYTEVSGGSITLEGTVRNWVQSTRTEAQTTQGQSGLMCCGIGDFIKDVLSRQPSIDWGLYDNDGPDRVPNSPDDDGFVDALAVIHPSRGAECNGATGRIWSHKWNLSDASTGRAPYVTSTPSTNGGFILIDDYFVQGVLDCDGSSLNPIGVFTHETGHAFGLPDLYDTRQSGAEHAGVGIWELMSSGTWGCNGNNPARPCHMGAWSKAMLGWADVTTLPPDTDFGTLTLPPVETTGVVYRVDAADGSGEYFLLENRQDVPSRMFDKNLLSEGLLVWHIDWNAVLSRWTSNTVNASDHMGVWLRQADGRNDLGLSGGGRGDSGDPFPGSTGNTQFHTSSTPGSRSFPGTATGLTVLGITKVVDDVQLRLLTRFTTLTVGATGTAGGSAGLFTVNGAGLAAPPNNFVRAAPFESRTVVAAAGESLGPGERRPFIEWTDARTSPRSRTVTLLLADTSFTAAYGGTEYELAITSTGGVNGVAPGSFTTVPAPADPTSSGLWFVPATDVQVTALPQTGFRFSAWTGPLSDQPNPAMVTMSAPVQAGAAFQLVYALADTRVDLVATVTESLQLAAQNGTAPVTWAVLGGTVPEGITVSAGGLVSGAALDFGAFPLTVRATDAIGLTATATLTLDIAAPAIPLAELASKFVLGGPALDGVEEAFLDRQGNGNGSYDLGDFRAWVLANPSLPLSAALAAPSGPDATRTLTLPMRLQEPAAFGVPGSGREEVR